MTTLFKRWCYDFFFYNSTYHNFFILCFYYLKKLYYVATIKKRYFISRFYQKSLKNWSLYWSQNIWLKLNILLVNSKIRRFGETC